MVASGGGATWRWGVSRGELGVVLIAVVLLFSCGRCEGRGCHDGERRALLEIKRSINFPGGSALPDWRISGADDDCCRWSGVTCDPITGRVVEIDLHEERTLVDEAWSPSLASLAELTELQSLDLGANQMSGDFPDVFCHARRLRKLSLTANSLGGPVPPCLCSMHSLAYLDLSGNQFQGQIPQCLCGMSSLTHLYLFDNKLQGAIPPCLDELHSLIELDVSINQLQGPVPPSLCSSHSLVHLDISYNGLQGSVPSCLGALRRLKYLYFEGNQFEGSIPPIFHNLTELTHLGLGGDRLEGTLVFSSFANLTKLEIVSIYSNYSLEIDTESPSPWVPSFQLSTLIVSNSEVNRRSGNRLPSFLPTQNRLHYLHMLGASVAGSNPLSLFCNSSLTSMDLRGNELQGPLHLPCRNTSSNAYYINLSYNRIRGSLPRDTGLFFPTLIYLNVAANELEGSVPASLGQMPLLLLDLSNNKFSGEVPHALTRNRTELYYLNVSFNSLEGEMFHGQAYLPNLRFLFLNHNRLTGSVLRSLSNASNLEALDAGHNGFSDNLSRSVPQFPSMTVLSLRENRLMGPLPAQLCEMENLHLLDLFGNSLSGQIPPCVNNISFWKSKNEAGPVRKAWWLDKDASQTAGIIYFTSKNMLSPYKGDPLSWMTGLDLSSNMIDGLIPLEVGQLKGLRSLNLSNNFLRGSIPASLGDMDDLESLDLSHNDLSGEIPREIVRLHFISSFSVAFNNLSGMIPFERQFSSFSRKSYEGNQGLCGPPLEMDCPSDRHETREIRASRDESASLEDAMFYTFLALSVGLGFWGLLGTLLLNRRWRMRYFNAIDGYFDSYVESFRTDGTHSFSNLSSW